MNETQPQQAATAPVYQTTVLTPNMVQALIMDDSPDMLFNKFWAFLGVDIPVADIQPWDFKNILDSVDLIFINMLQEYPESEWEKVVIAEYENQIIDGATVQVLVKAYKVVELWDAMRGKIYVKMCRAREGFTLKQLTESRSYVSEELHTNSVTTQQGPTNKSRWRFW